MFLRGMRPNARQRPNSASRPTTATHTAWVDISLDQQLAERIAEAMLQRPRATGEAGPTRDEWLRAAAAYSKRVQATVRTRKAAAAAALPADKNATSPRKAEPFVPQVLVAAPPASLPSTDELWEELRAIRERGGRSGSSSTGDAAGSGGDVGNGSSGGGGGSQSRLSIVPPEPRTPLQLCVVSGAGRLEGRPDERMWHGVREAAKLSENYLRIERICERAKQIKVEQPWEPSWARAGERLSFESFEAEKRLRAKAEEGVWTQVEAMIDKAKGRLQTFDFDATQDATGEEDPSTAAVDPTPSQATTREGTGIHSAAAKKPGSTRGKADDDGRAVTTVRETLAAAEGRQPTQPIEGWPWRMPLPLLGPYEQIMAERAEANRVRPLSAGPAKFGRFWAEEPVVVPVATTTPGQRSNDDALLRAGGVHMTSREHGRMMGGSHPHMTSREHGRMMAPPKVGSSSMNEGTSGDDEHAGSTVGPISPRAARLHAEPISPGVQRDPVTGQLRFNAAMPSSHPQPPATARRAHPRTAPPRRAVSAEQRTESPVPGPWRASSRPCSGTSSRPSWSRPGSGCMMMHSRGFGEEQTLLLVSAARKSSRPVSGKSSTGVASAPSPAAAARRQSRPSSARVTTGLETQPEAAPELNWQEATF